MFYKLHIIKGDGARSIFKNMFELWVYYVKLNKGCVHHDLIGQVRDAESCSQLAIIAFNG